MTHAANNRGIAMIAVILILSFLMALAATLSVAVNMDTKLRGAFGRSMTGFYAAEAGLNKGMGDYKDIFLNFHVPIGSDFNTKTLTVGNRTVTYQLTDAGGNPQDVIIPSGQIFGGLHAIQYTYNATSAATNTWADTEASVGSEFQVGYIPLFQFIAFYSNDLEIEPGANMHLHGRVHSNGNMYLNSDAHLYIEDNPPDITTVQVSAKGTVYRGRKDTTVCAGTVTVDMLTDANLDGNLDPKDLPCNGATTRAVPISELSTWNGSMISNIQSISVPPPDITTKGTGGGTGGIYWQNAELRIVLRASGARPYSIVVEDVNGNIDAVKNPILQNFMTTVQASSSMRSTGGGGTWPIFYTDVPTGGGCTDAIPLCNNVSKDSYTPPFSSDNRVYSGNMISVDLKTVTPTRQPTPVGTATWTPTGSPTATPPPAPVGSATVTPTPGPDYRRGGFYNQREDKWMYLLNINLQDLLTWNAAQSSSNRLFDPADATDGGIVLFLSVSGPDSLIANRYGVRIFGSSTLPFPAIAAGGDPTGITVVSDQAIYVAGDYNSGGVKQPAAIMGDTVNVLSNAYFDTSNYTMQNDRQSNLGLLDAARNASSTTINTAFLAGTDTTTSGNYNGGLENYPRFHENWSGDTLTYAGSFVSLGTPVHAVGPWCGTGATCNIYNPPTRNWDYDPDFNDAKNLPPLTPRFVYVQQVLFTEDFK